MKILILNWRDIKNPSSGGAEILTHELSKRWIKDGHKVVQFSSLFFNAKKSEVIDGIKIIRKGSPDARALWNSVHFQAFKYYMKNFKGKFDVVIDEIHGLPFFTPLYVKEKKIVLICEVADELWFTMYGRLLGSIGRLIEILYLKIIYKSINFLTISNSTKNDLVRNGINANHINVIPMGVKLPDFKINVLKEKNPTILFVGRLSVAKGIEDALIVLKNILYEIPHIKLWIIGRGNEVYTDFLKKKILKEKINNRISFFGFVSERRKFELMAKAHLLISPTIKEGFGLTIPEAGSVGTPSIAYNVNGLRDIIINEENGILVKSDPNEMSRAVIKIIQNPTLYKKLCENAKKLANNFDLDKSAKQTLNLIKQNSK